MLDKVFRTLTQNKLANPGETVLTAVSGGPDSVCLLHILHTLSSKLEIKVCAVHVNHLLRGSESDEDERYVRRLCERLGLPLRVCPADIAVLAAKSGMSLEEAGREARYGIFAALADELGAQKIAVAHNRNDQAETVMMHIIRGSGLTGLVGMEAARGRIIRPLLDVSRREIEHYCEENGLQPRTDSSNLTGDYARNRVRLELLPRIDKNFGADITGSLCKLSALAALDNSYMEEKASEAFEACMVKETNPAEEGLLLDAAKLAGIHPAISGRVLRRAAAQVKGDLKGLERVHVEAMEDLVRNGRTGAVLQLPGGLRTALAYGRLRVYREEAEEPAGEFCCRVNIPGVTGGGSFRGTLEAEVSSLVEKVDKYGKIGYNSFVQYFDYDLLNEGIYVRSRQEGDIFRPFGSNGTKKLKEFFIDTKVPKDSRRKIPLVALGKDIVWVIGYKTSDKFKVTENTKRVLTLKYVDGKQ